MTSPLLESAAKELAKWQSAFTPRRFLRNAHLQTLAGNFFPRTAVLPPPENELIEVEAAHEGVPSSRVLCQSHWQPEAGRDTVLLLHGLEGSSDSQYVRGNSARFYAAGWNVVRMNMRNCGGTERECADVVPLRAVGRCAGGGAAFSTHARCAAMVAGGLLDGRQPGAEAGG